MPTFINRSSTGTTDVPSFGIVPRLVSQVVDFSTFAGGFLVADIARVMAIPDNTAILAAGVEVLTAGTGTGTIALADTLGSPNTFVAAATPTTLGQMTRTAAGAAATYTGGTTRFLTLTGATATRTNGVVRVWALILDLDTRNTTAGVYTV